MFARIQHHRQVAVSIAKVAACCLVIVGMSLEVVSCHSAREAAPTITFQKVPPATRGGRERVDTISGSVVGASNSQKIVIYARSGPWWVQPWPDRALTQIQEDSTWNTETHLGYEYAALLVNPDYRPAPTLDSIPGVGRGIIAIKVTKGAGSLPPIPMVPIHFSGYDWKIDTTSGVRGGFNQIFSSDNVWVDKDGALHLRMRHTDKGWVCAHLLLGASLGYGTYSFRIRDASHLDAASILSFNTFDVWAPDQHYRELDVELGRWGNAESAVNSQVGLQPFYVPGNVVQFHDPPGVLTHVLQWQPGKAIFETYASASLKSPKRVPLYRRIFDNGVPSAGQELPEFMFYRVSPGPKALEKTSEVVIEQFTFTP